MTNYQRQKIDLALEKLEEILSLFEKREHYDSYFDERNEDYITNPYYSMVERVIETLEETE